MTIDAYKLGRLIAGHSNYSGDKILSAIYCMAEGKEIDHPITPLDEERPKGEWIEKVHQDCFGTKETICPFCNFSMVEWWGVKNYCPNCGAEMHEKGKKNE